MNLQGLVDYLRRNILNDRSDRISGTSDYLWEDSDLVTFVNEAQIRFAIKSYCLHDSMTPEVVVVTVKQGVTQYDLHPAIIDVITAQMTGQPADLTRIGHSVLNSFTNPADRVIYTTGFEQLPPGPPQAFLTDETIVQDDDGSYGALLMRLYPIPRAEDDGSIIKLRVVRKPLDDLVPTNMGAVPEVPVEHHVEMLAWAAHLALAIADDDAGSQSLSDKYAAKFQDYTEEARKLVMRKMFAPQPWGFGRNGWNWGGPQHGGYV